MIFRPYSHAAMKMFLPILRILEGIYGNGCMQHLECVALFYTI